jgi:predicted lipid-binding transport protein (Tim44 family)
MLLWAVFFIVFIVFFLKLFHDFGKISPISQLDRDDQEKQKPDKMKRIIEKKPIYYAEGLNQSVDRLCSIFDDFSPSRFVDFANEYFDSVFLAFSRPHYEVLKQKLSSKLYEDFCQNIEKREAKNLRQEIKVEHKNTLIESIIIGDRVVSIIVTFVVSQMSAIINAIGKSVDNPNRISIEATHRWTLEREITTKKSSWILIRTQSFEKNETKA